MILYECILAEIEPLILAVILTNLNIPFNQEAYVQSPITNCYHSRNAENRRKTSGQTAHVTGISADSQCSAAKIQQDFVGFLV